MCGSTSTTSLQKRFFVHADDAALLPLWNGLQLNNFMLGLEDNVPGGYFDGTDRHPAADPALTINEFGGFIEQVRLQLGAGQLVGTPSSFTLTPVPEFSTGTLAAMGMPTAFSTRRRRR